MGRRRRWRKYQREQKQETERTGSFENVFFLLQTNKKQIYIKKERMRERK